MVISQELDLRWRERVNPGWSSSVADFLDIAEHHKTQTVDAQYIICLTDSLPKSRSFNIVLPPLRFPFRKPLDLDSEGSELLKLWISSYLWWETDETERVGEIFVTLLANLNLKMN
jgi:hypothetical protein